MTKSQFNAETLADYLDEKFANGHTPPLMDDDPLADAAFLLAHTPLPMLPDTARERIRSQVLDAHKLHYIPNNRTIPFRIPWSLTAGLAAVLLLVFLPFASASAVPGDFLYPVKRAYERTELNTASLFNTEHVVLLWHAQRRTEEAVILVKRGAPVNELIMESVNALSLATGEIVLQVPNRVDNTPPIEVVAPQTVASNAVPHTSPEPEIDLSAETQEPQTQPSDILRQVVEQFSETTNTMRFNFTAIERPLIPADLIEDQNNLVYLEEPGTAFVNAYARVYVRSRPVNGAVIDTVAPLTRVLLLAENSDTSWSIVQLPNGTIGWVAKFLLYEGDTPPPALPTRPVEQVNHEGSNSESNNGLNATASDTENEGRQSCGERGNSCNSQGVPGGTSPGNSGNSNGGPSGRTGVPN